MSREKRVGPITAAELMAKLDRDPGFVQRRREADERIKFLEARFEEAEKPLVHALNDIVGISVKSVWDLVNTSQECPQAIPILISHLKYQYPYRIREGIARALTVKYAGEAAYTALVNEFNKVPNSADEAG